MTGPDGPDTPDLPAEPPGDQPTGEPGLPNDAVDPDDDLAWLSRHGHNRRHNSAGLESSLGRSTRPGRSRRRRRRRRSRRHHHWYRPRNTIVFPLLAVVLLVVGFLLYVNHELASIRRAPLDAPYAGKTSAGTNVLLIASDARETAVQADVPTMVVQLVHIGANGANTSLIDLPRDLVLPATEGQARATVGVRYLRSGASGLNTSLQDLLGLTIDHVVLATYTGYAKATDRLGGVDINTVNGIEHLSGAQARAYVVQKGITSVDAGHRNQQWMRGMIEGSLTPGVLLNPFKIIGLLRDLTPNLVVDDGFTTGAIRSLGWHSRGLSPQLTRYLTVPHKDYVPAGGGRVLMPDVAAIRQLGAAIRADNDSGIAVFDN